MRKVIIASCVLGAACAGGGANADSARLRDSIPAGSAAAPATVAPESAATATSGATTAPAGTAGASATAGSTGNTTTRASQPPAGQSATGAQTAADRRTSRASTLTPGAAVDSVRGTVSVVGTSFDRRVMLAEAGTQRRLEVVGAQSRLVGHLAGAVLDVVGTVSGSQIDAQRFVVRSVDNQPAIDGTLETEGGTLYIVSAGGTRTHIANPPPPLVGQDGARVWITGDPSRGVASFGFIDPPR